jgi:hypothetical protein
VKLYQIVIKTVLSHPRDFLPVTVIKSILTQAKPDLPSAQGRETLLNRY